MYNFIQFSTWCYLLYVFSLRANLWENPCFLGANYNIIIFVNTVMLIKVTETLPGLFKIPMKWCS